MKKAKKLRVLCLMHQDLVPPASKTGVDEKTAAEWKMEFDVCSTLTALGHEIKKLGVLDELLPIRHAIEEFKPHIVFNLLEEFAGQAAYDQNVVGYLELMGMRYTGCHSRGLVIARDKALSKKVLNFHRVKVPGFVVYRRGRKIAKPKRLQYPMIVKSLIEEASLGIAKASLVDSDEKLEERVKFVHANLHTDAIAEEFVSGRELYVGVLGNERLQVLPTWELLFKKEPPDAPRIATAKVKWDKEYQKRHGIVSKPAKISEDLERYIQKISKRIYRALELKGYARLDFRLSQEQELFFLEANPNPQLSQDEDFAQSAKTVGISYKKLIQRILNLGMRVLKE